MNQKIMGIFPIPILYEEDSYTFSEEEIKYLYESKTRKPSYNTLSDSAYVIESKKAKNIKKFFQQKLNYYSKEVLKIQEEFYITNTWFTKNKPGETHIHHRHPNSIFSGVLYAYAKEGMGNIKFHIERPMISQTFDLEYKISEYNLFNSSSWWLPSRTGTLIIFPSWLNHSVEENTTNEERMVIGFNTFVRGNLGETNRYTNLNLY